MLSYHGDSTLKDRIVAEMKHHREMDQFVKGTYHDKDSNDVFKGCAVGCAIDSMNKVLGKSYITLDHEVFEESLGIPAWLAHLQDHIFEGLPDGKGGDFAVSFLKSIPVGMDLDPVRWHFGAYLMRDNIKRLKSVKNIYLYLNDINEDLYTQVLDILNQSLYLNDESIKNGVWDEEKAYVIITDSLSIIRNTWKSSRILNFAVESASYSVKNHVWSVYQSASHSAIMASWMVRTRPSIAKSRAYKRYAREIIRILKNLEKNGE